MATRGSHLEWPAWRTSPALLATAGLMLPFLLAALIGLVVDPRIVTGAPIWLKPAKFAISIFIYAITLAWAFTLIPGWPRTRKIVGRVTAATLTLEMAIIVAQVLRGTSSHFNVSTPLNGALFATMGTAIVVQTITSVAVVVALWRTRFADPALGWALRLGLLITIVGASAGGIMTQPTSAQLAAARSGATMTTVGAHTVGGMDGGPGLPGTGWSVQHGDLRVPHFIGLHAFQALPIVALLMRRRQPSDALRTKIVFGAAAAYVLLFVLLLWQALHGVPVLSVGGIALAAAGAAVIGVVTWLAASPHGAADAIAVGR